MRYRSIVTLPFFIATAMGIVAPVSGADLLVFADLSRHTLFDQYEQPLSDAAKKLIGNNAPFEIISERQLMGDGITPAMRLSHASATFHLPLDEKSKPGSVFTPAGAIRLRNCTRHNDTMTVTRPFSLFEKHPSSGTTVSLAKGERVLRLYTCAGITLVARPGRQPLYGWAKIPREALSAVRQPPRQQQDDYHNLHLRIMKRLNDANSRYDALFSYFNERTGQQKSRPRWESSQRGTQRLYTLSGSQEMINGLASSTMLIMSDIDYILLGRPYTATYRDGIISVESH